MVSLKRIIKEEYVKLLKEINYSHDEDIDYNQFDREDELKHEMFNDFLYRNTPDFTKHVPWTVIPFPRLKKIWEDYMTYGSIRDTRGLEMIEEIMINNTSKVSIFTNLAGHTQWGDEEAFNENIGYWVNEQLNCLFPSKKVDTSQLEIPYENPKKGFVQKKSVPDPEPCNTTIHPFVQTFYNDNYDEDITREKFYELLFEEMKGRFFDYYQNDPEGKLGGFISDYGLKPLEELLVQLLRASSPEEKLLIIDRMLNVVHQRSDIADWFVEGGSHALAQLSSSPAESTKSLTESNKPVNLEAIAKQSVVKIGETYDKNDFIGNCIEISTDIANKLNKLGIKAIPMRIIDATSVEYGTVETNHAYVFLPDTNKIIDTQLWQLKGKPDNLQNRKTVFSYNEYNKIVSLREVEPI